MTSIKSKTLRLLLCKIKYLPCVYSCRVEGNFSLLLFIIVQSLTLFGVPYTHAIVPKFFHGYRFYYYLCHFPPIYFPLRERVTMNDVHDIKRNWLDTCFAAIKGWHVVIIHSPSSSSSALSSAWQNERENKLECDEQSYNNLHKLVLCKHILWL